MSVLRDHDLSFQALIGTVETHLELAALDPQGVFQALIGTVETVQPGHEQPISIQSFQALIGTVETPPVLLCLKQTSRFKPS